MRKNNKVMLISIVAAVVLVIIVFLLLFLCTDIFKSNKEVFSKYLSESGSKITSNGFVKTYIDANIRRLSENNSTSTDIELYSTDGTEENATKLGKVSISSLKDANLKQDYKIVKISNGNEELAAVKFVRDGNIYGIGAENVLTKYIAIDGANIRNFAGKLGVEDTEKIPNEITEIDYNKLLSVNDETYQNLKKKYVSIILNNIEEEKYSKVKNQDKTESLILTLTNQDVANLLEKVLEEAKNDDTLLDIITEKASEVKYGMEKADLQLKIASILNKLRDKEIPEGEFRISLLIKNKQVIKYIIETPNIDSDEYKIDGRKIEIDCESNNKIVINTESQNEIFKTVINYAYNENVINLEIIAYSVKDGQEQEVFYLKDELLNYNTDKFTETIKANILIDDQKYEIDLQKETNYKQDIQIDKLTTDNSARVDLMTDEQINQLIAALIQRIQKLYGTQMNELYKFTNDVI